MNRVSSIDVLNKLVAIHNRSFPTYLADVRPWSSLHENSSWVETIQLIADSHKSTVDRIGTTILANDGAVDMGEYPMEFTGMHDLSLDYLLKSLIAYQEKDIARIEVCVDQLGGDAMAKELAEEVLGEAKGHLESLRELTATAPSAS